MNVNNEYEQEKEYDLIYCLFIFIPKAGWYLSIFKYFFLIKGYFWN